MLQEIITYMIIGSAVTLAVLKIVKRFSRKKRGKKATGQNTNSGHVHNCSACSAECQLRDLPRVVKEKNIDECARIEKKSKLLQS